MSSDQLEADWGLWVFFAVQVVGLGFTDENEDDRRLPSMDVIVPKAFFFDMIAPLSLLLQHYRVRDC